MSLLRESTDNKNSCWVTNLTNRKVVIGDLRWTIKPHTTVDLLDPRHSNLTSEQVEQSRKSGSLAKREKQEILKIRLSEPELNNKSRTIDISKTSFPFKAKSLVQLEQKKFEELEFEEHSNSSDLTFANEQAEIDLDEHQPKVNIREKKKSKKDKE